MRGTVVKLNAWGFQKVIRNWGCRPKEGQQSSWSIKNSWGNNF